MGLQNEIHQPNSASLIAYAVESDHRRPQRILAMRTAFIEMFGASALSIACGQPSAGDVGGNSGIFWHDLVKAMQDSRDANSDRDVAPSGT